MDNYLGKSERSKVRRTTLHEEIVDAIGREPKLPSSDIEELRLTRSGRSVIDDPEQYALEHPNTAFGQIAANTVRRKKGLTTLPLTTADGKEVASSSHRLKAVLHEWERLKTEEGTTETYLDDAKRAFDRFISVIGNRSISDLTPDDFAIWRRWVIREGKDRSFKWENDQHKHVKTILRAVKMDKPSWLFPDGMIEWASSWKRKKYLPAKGNRSKLPVKDFERLLATADRWAAVRAEDFSKTSQKGRAKRLQAQRKQLQGIRFGCILQLAANCALDNVDVRRIEWKNIKDLNDDMPYLDFPRTKPKKQVGGAIERLTPLLPSTVTAIRRVRRADPRDGVIFRTAQGAAYSETGLSNALKALFKDAGVTGHTFKSLRNIAPSLGKAAKRSKDERDAILGHAVEGTSKFYEDEVGVEYLCELVNLVGKEYFDGEAVVPAQRRPGLILP